MKDLKISELLAMGETVVKYMEEKLGYDTVYFHDVTIRSMEETQFFLTYRDDFQKELPANLQFKNGGYRAVSVEDIWDTLRAWPNREQRELHVMAAKLASIDANLDEIKSAQVRAFVARLQPQIDEIRAMITHQPNAVEVAMRADDADTDDEIPF